MTIVTQIVPRYKHFLGVMMLMTFVPIKLAKNAAIVESVGPNMYICSSALIPAMIDGVTAFIIEVEPIPVARINAQPIIALFFRALAIASICPSPSCFLYQSTGARGDSITGLLEESLAHRFIHCTPSGVQAINRHFPSAPS
jgi:hypothetical protein